MLKSILLKDLKKSSHNTFCPTGQVEGVSKLKLQRRDFVITCPVDVILNLGRNRVSWVTVSGTVSIWHSRVTQVACKGYPRSTWSCSLGTVGRERPATSEPRHVLTAFRTASPANRYLRKLDLKIKYKIFFLSVLGRMAQFDTESLSHRNAQCILTELQFMQTFFSLSVLDQMTQLDLKYHSYRTTMHFN